MVISNKKQKGLGKKVRLSPLETKTGSKAVHNVAFWGLAVLLFFPPFFRGLFFPSEQYKALIFAAIVFWLAWFWNQKKGGDNFFDRPLDFLVLALPVAYLASSFSAANTGLAVDEVIENTLYFMIYWSTSRLVTGKDSAVKIFHVVYLAAVGLALAGLLTSTGLLYIKDGFMSGRIYSAFQYPNALASYLIAALFIGIYLWQKNEKSPLYATLGIQRVSSGSFLFVRFASYFYSLGTYIICIALVGTKSNGGFLVLLVTLGIYFIFVKGAEKLRLFTYLLTILLPAAVVARMFIRSALDQNSGKAWLIFISGLILVLALLYLNNRLTGAGFWEMLFGKKSILVLCTAAIILAGGLILYNYVAVNQEMVNKVVAEFRLRNATERIYFYSDALKMVKERPIIGWGGGGWQEAYRLYQGYLYNSNQVHSYYLQVLVETGVAGLAVVFGIWGFFFYVTHRLYHDILKGYSERLLLLTLFTAALAIGGHAVIDFDLSLSALTMVLFTLFGMSAGLLYNAKKRRDTKAVQSKTKLYGSFVSITAICLAVIIIAASFSSAEAHVKEAGLALQKGDAKTAADLLILATRENPFKPEYNTNLAGIYAKQGKIDLAMVYSQKALDRAGYESANYAQLAGLYLASAQYDKAVAHAEKAVENAPYQIMWYEFLGHMYINAGLNLLSQGKNREAEKMFAGAAGLEDRINRKVSQLGDLEKRLWNMAPMLAPTPPVNIYSGAALCLTGRYSESEKALKNALADEKLKGETLLWLGILSHKQGKSESSDQYLRQASEILPNAKDQFDMISRLSL